MVTIIWTGVRTKADIALISLGSGATVAGTGLIIKGNEGLETSTAEIKRLTEKLSNSQAQIVSLSVVKNQLEYLIATVDGAINSLQNVSNQWYAMRYKYETLNNSAATTNSEDTIFIREDLTIAKNDWADIKKYAEQLYVKEILSVDRQ
ncbi:TPA: hypothetical protein ACLQU7_004815 [Bacillus tropicus]|uniref:hypothetical protein n=1 Tax=Bacillus cereus group TaxID=86661 RepID=UPI00003CB5BA|nr:MULTISPECIES: hypothetical protein [Bacillus cereus group]AIY73020.1 putative enterotoxin B [Bacillus cereus]EAL15957.1 enterotoxin B [Bacillus cereus G9241]QPS53442.1 hypothetical protein I6G54_28815 [Bacillus tropicus]